MTEMEVKNARGEAEARNLDPMRDGRFFCINFLSVAEYEMSSSGEEGLRRGGSFSEGWGNEDLVEILPDSEDLKRGLVGMVDKFAA